MGKIAQFLSGQIKKSVICRAIIICIVALVITISLFLGLAYLLCIGGIERNISVSVAGSIIVGIFALITILTTLHENEKTRMLAITPSLTLKFGKNNTSENTYVQNPDFEIQIPDAENKYVFKIANLWNEGNSQAYRYVPGWWRLDVDLIDIGNGPAQNVGFSYSNNQGEAISCFEHQCLTTSNHLKGFIYIHSSNKSIDLSFVAKFEDICGNSYTQTHGYKIIENQAPIIEIGTPKRTTYP